MFILVNFYDILYFEYAAKFQDGNMNVNTLFNNNIFTSDFINDLNKIKCVITDNHLFSLLSALIGFDINRENLIRNVKENKD